MKFSSLVVFGLSSAKAFGCSVTKGNEDISNLIYKDGVRCDDSFDCNEAVISGCDDVICAGDKTCVGATIESFTELTCQGEMSCNKAVIASDKDNATLNCKGTGACHEASIDLPSGVAKCKGLMACTSAASFQTGYLQCQDGKKSCDISNMKTDPDNIVCGQANQIPNEKCFEKVQKASIGAEKRPPKPTKQRQTMKGKSNENRPVHKFDENTPPGQGKGLLDQDQTPPGQAKNIEKLQSTEDKGGARKLRSSAVANGGKESRLLRQCSACLDLGAPTVTGEWHDIDGDYFNCQWYADNIGYGFCNPSTAALYANFGVDATQACCACGGGYEGEFDAGYGNCATYAPGNINHSWCPHDYDSDSQKWASQVCTECGAVCAGGGHEWTDFKLFSNNDDDYGSIALVTPANGLASGVYGNLPQIDTTVGDSLQGVGNAFEALGTILGGLSGLGAAGGIIAGVGPVLSITSMVLGLAGVNTDTSTSPGFEFLNQKFGEINGKLDDLQEQMSVGFNEIKSLIAIVEVQIKVVILNGIKDAYEDFTTTTSHDNRENLYGPNFRAACNGDVEKKPDNIFWWLYGHTCKTCQHGGGSYPYENSKFITIAKGSADYKIRKFQEFQRVMQDALVEAMYLYALCLPPTKGALIDRHNDNVFTGELAEMQAALYEVQAHFNEVDTLFYQNWPTVFNAYDLGSISGTNDAIADAVHNKLSLDYPKNDIQVIVYDHTSNDDQRTRGGSARGKGDTASFLYIDNRYGKNFHIRYKPKWALHKTLTPNFYEDFKSHRHEQCWYEKECCFIGCWDCSYAWLCCSEAHREYDCLLEQYSRRHNDQDDSYNKIRAGEGYLIVKYGNGLRARWNGNFYTTNDFNRAGVQDFTWIY